jgi:hypothetical protein
MSVHIVDYPRKPFKRFNLGSDYRTLPTVGPPARLTAQGLPDAAIQLISRHSSRKSLEVYQHLSLKGVEPGYQKARPKLPQSKALQRNG